MEWNELVPFPVLAVLGFGGWMLVRAVRGRHWALRALGRTFGVLLLVSSSGLLAIYSCSQAYDHKIHYRSAPNDSPDGRHSARVIQGGQSDFGTAVEVRTRWHVYPQVVFSSDDDPHYVRLQWSGTKRLFVEVPELTGDWRRNCVSPAGDIVVSCISYGP